MAIHPTAVIDRQAELDPTVEVGACAVIEGPVQIGPGTRVYPHAYVTGWTQIGANCQIHPFAAIGGPPQDKKFADVRSYCRIGDGTIMREGFSAHRGTESESVTQIGRNCYLMANAHVAHNCRLGDEVTLINGVLLAGHVTIGDRAVLGGGALVHQFVRIGEGAMAAGLARVNADLPPFFMAAFNNSCVGVNRVGLRRCGCSVAEVREIARAYRRLYREDTMFAAAVAELGQTLTTAAGRRLVEFLAAPSRRGFVSRPGRRLAGGADGDSQGEP